MEEKKKKKVSARERLTHSLGFGKKSEDSSSEEDRFVDEVVQSTWIVEDDDGQAEVATKLLQSDTKRRNKALRSRSPGPDGSDDEGKRWRVLKKSLSSSRRRKGRRNSDKPIACDDEQGCGPSLAYGSHDEHDMSSIGNCVHSSKGESKEASKKKKSKTGKKEEMELESFAVPGRSRSTKSSRGRASSTRARSSSTTAKPALSDPLLLKRPKAHSRGRSPKKVDSAPPPNLPDDQMALEMKRIAFSEEGMKEKKNRPLSSAAVDDQPVEFADERRRRIPAKLRKSSSLSKLLSADEMSALRGDGLRFGNRDKDAGTRGAEQEDDDDFDKPQPEDTVLRSKGRSGWRSLLKKSQLSRIDLKKSWKPGALLHGRKTRSHSEVSRRVKKEREVVSPTLPCMAYREVAELNSMESMKLMLAGDERLPSFKRFLGQTFSSENLQFYEAVTEFRACENDEESREIAARTMKTFIGNSAPLELNLDTRDVRKLEMRWDELDCSSAGTVVPKDIFDGAFEAVFSLLYYDLYMRYIVSDLFADFEAGVNP